MTISELIGRLECLREKHGDLPVYRPDMHVMAWPIREARYGEGRTVTAPDPFDPPVEHPDHILLS